MEPRSEDTFTTIFRWDLQCGILNNVGNGCDIMIQIDDSWMNVFARNIFPAVDRDLN